MKTCLVVDDSDVVRKVARHIFPSFKFDSREADTALDACQAAMPDAILLDWQMRHWAASNSCRPCAACPTAARRTSYIAPPRNNARDIALALSSGADDYVLKPFEREAIQAKLAAAGLV
jgi:two-component system, chemotaxis family, chemotaxis protein CheY